MVERLNSESFTHCSASDEVCGDELEQLNQSGKYHCAITL